MLLDEKHQLLILTACNFKDILQVLIELLRRRTADVGKRPELDTMGVANDFSRGFPEAAGTACQQDSPPFDNLLLKGSHEINNLID